MLFRLLLVAMAIGLPSVANASDWVMFGQQGTKPHRHIVFVDRSSIQTVAGNRRAWVAFVAEDAADQNQELKSYDEVDCSERKSRSLQINVIDRQGKPSTSAATRGWEYQVPDTPGASILEHICTEDFSDGVPIQNRTLREGAEIWMHAVDNAH